MAMARAKHGLFLLLHSRRFFSLDYPLCRSPNTLSPSYPTAAARGFCSDGISDLRDRILRLSENPASVSTASADKEAVRSAVSALADELLALPDGQDPAVSLGSGSFDALLRLPPAGFASVELLSRLKSRPLLALQVLHLLLSLFLAFAI